MIRTPALALLLTACSIQHGANKHSPIFGWRGRDVSHERTVVPNRLVRDGLEVIITRAWVREAGTIFHKDGTTLLMEGEVINHRSRNLMHSGELVTMFTVVGPSGKRYSAPPIFRGGLTERGWLPVQENTGVPYYLPPGARGLLSFQVSFAGDDGEGELVLLEFLGERAELR